MSKEEVLPSIILIFGDQFVSRNLIIATKKKFPDAEWVTVSASENLDIIRMEAGISSWEESKKFVVIEDLPNQKAVREFLLDLAISCPPTTTLIIWDSEDVIKIDPQTKQLNKSWTDFLQKFKELPHAKVINNGTALTEKQAEDSTTLIKKRFELKNKLINHSEIKLLTAIVGYDRGLLVSEIDKLCINCPSPITSEFILQNAFPSSKEAVVYKIGDVLDSGNYEASIEIIERFILSGENENRIAETLLHKARWQMLTAYYWANGLDWYEISERLMSTGKFPSTVWNDPKLTFAEKKREAEEYEKEDKLTYFVQHKLGIPFMQRNVNKDKPPKAAPRLPAPFLAEKTVGFVRDRIVRPNQALIKDERILKEKVLNRAIRIYLFIQSKLASIRYGDNPSQDIQEMTRAMTNLQVDNF